MTNERSVSTTFAWKRVKISRPPEATPAATTKSSRWRRLPRRDSRKPLTVVVKYRGGPECWVEVRARGEVNRYPGYTQLVDLVRDMNGER